MTLLMTAFRPSTGAKAFSDHFRQMYEDVMTVMRIRTFQLIILQVPACTGSFAQEHLSCEFVPSHAVHRQHCCSEACLRQVL